VDVPLAIAIWAFARAYYFAVYVIEQYEDTIAGRVDERLHEPTRFRESPRA
jgi:hypothetical protein